MGKGFTRSLTSVLAMGLVVVGCTSGDKEVAPRATTVPVHSNTTAVARTQAPPVCDERDASTTSAEHHPSKSVWALVFSERPYYVGHLIKVVWHVAGSGDTELVVVRPSGALGKLEFGPDARGGSSYTRPGDE